MSRTWKDRPSRIQSVDPRNFRDSVEFHFCGPRWVALKSHEEVFTSSWSWFGYESSKEYTRTVVTLWGTEYTECTLDQSAEHTSSGEWASCRRTPINRIDWNFDYSKTYKNDRKNYNKRVKAQEKNVSKRLRDEYNACGIIEEDYIYPPHRAERGWWN